MIRKIANLGLRLSLVCALAAFGLSFTYSVTRERIAQQIWESQIKAARAVLPEVETNEDFTEREDIAARIREDVRSVDKIFEGFKNGELVGYAVQMLPRGYGGPITLMVGLSLEGVVTDISIVDHKETPGLGSYIENPAWSGQFRGKTAGDQLKVNKDIDSVSGATISSKAVTRGVKEALGAHALLAGEGT